MKTFIAVFVLAIFLFTPLGSRIESGNITADVENTMTVQKDHLSTLWQSVNNELADYKLVLMTKLKNEHPYTDFVKLYEELGEITRLISPDAGQNGDQSVPPSDTVLSAASDSIAAQTLPVIVDTH